MTSAVDSHLGSNGAVFGRYRPAVDAAALDVAANVTGTYLVLVASFDSGFDGSGTYRITMTHTPGPDYCLYR
jgi:hypothetical protein